MLLVICGPSGIGKSTIINQLSRKWGWKIVATYMSRQVRVGETEKFQVAMEEFELTANYLCINEHFGNKYGTRLEDIVTAVQSKKVWMIDFGLADRDKILAEIPHHYVVLVPENEIQLKQQLEAADRTERVDLALESYREIYQYLASGVRGATGIVIENRKNQLSKTVLDIEEFVASVYPRIESQHIG